MLTTDFGYLSVNRQTHHTSPRTLSTRVHVCTAFQNQVRVIYLRDAHVRGDFEVVFGVYVVGRWFRCCRAEHNTHY